MNIVQRLAWPSESVPLVVRCLGRFRLDGVGGTPLPLRTRKARAMLACMALAGRPMSRESLAALLWSDRGAVQARSSVRQAIFELQHLGGGEMPVLAASREQVALSPELLVTDLELIQRAAERGDWARLSALLEASEPGLLTDLDGLDPEFDSWLRTQRGQEPSRTFAAVVAAAERCKAEAGPRAALDLVTAIVRLDPANEEAARVALSIDHELGDKAGLHRHFQLLCDRLREDYDAEPSAETVALFKALANGGAAAAADAAPSAAAPTADVQPEAKEGPGRVPALALWALLLLAVAALAALVLAERRPAAPGAVVVAVLPFDQQPRGDGFLASGLWEHTRAALTRNGAIRILGRSTTAAMAEQRVPPSEFRKRFGVTHLLEGTVRRTGEQVEVSVSLSQTSDGVAVWQAMFGGRMGEPLALQDRIAKGIEGQLRGRLAPGGGRRAEQIATVPEVYALYSEARQMMFSREGVKVARAEALLRRAVATDPNYAPAWALLGSAINLNGRKALTNSLRRREAQAAVRRSLELAPNLALAHANYALVEGLASPKAERALRRAIALDPNFAEAWNWLGNAHASDYRYADAIRAYQRAVAIDPLFPAAVLNLAKIATQAGDHARVDRLLADISRAGAKRSLTAGVKADRLFVERDYSGAIGALRELGLDAGGKAPGGLWVNWFHLLIASGQFDLLQAITDCPDWYAPMLRGEALPPKTVEGQPVTPEEFWTSVFFSHPASRAMVRLGQSPELVRLYRAEFRDADDFVTRTGERDLFAGLAPTIALALRQAGSADEASYLVAAAASRLEPAVKRPGGQHAMAELATIRAAQGERGRAIALLGGAVARGWMPDGRQHALDLAQEPAFASLTGDPRFEALRKRILDHIAKERAELGPVKL